MTPIQDEGIYCTVYESELEAKTREGWALVGVIETECVAQSNDIEVGPSGNPNSYNPTVTTVRSHLIKTPKFLLRRDSGSELGRMAQELEKAKQDLEASQTTLKHALTGVQKAEQRFKEDGAVIGDLRTMVKGLEDNRDQLSLALKRATEENTALHKRLGKAAKPTAFERLLTEDDDSASKKGSSV